MKVIRFLILLDLIILKNLAIGQVPIDTSMEKTADSIIIGSNANFLNKNEIAELRGLATRIQNQGFILEENQHNYKLALDKINSSIFIWKAINDTLNEANSLKYKGYLLGNLKQFHEAKKEIYLAIRLFDLCNKKYGIAVSEFDLSKVYERELKYDSSIYFATKSLNYWTSQQDTFRMATINNQLINIFLKEKRFLNANEIQVKSAVFFKEKEMHWKPLIDFYILSRRLFQLTGVVELEKKYRNLYNKEVKKLKLEGIQPTSSY
jgi:tetratricopeptide (TPR) repeat protein